MESSAKRAKVDTPSPTPTFVDDEDDPAIIIDFREDQVLLSSFTFRSRHFAIYIMNNFHMHPLISVFMCVTISRFLAKNPQI